MEWRLIIQARNVNIYKWAAFKIHELFVWVGQLMCIKNE